MKWKPGEIDGACELLNERVYKRLAKKCHTESMLRQYVPGKKYYCQSLYRDARVKGLHCLVSVAVKRKSGLECPEFIKVGLDIFRCVKIDCFQQHCIYELDNTVKM